MKSSRSLLARSIPWLASRAWLLFFCACITLAVGLPVLMLFLGAFRSARPGFESEWTVQALLNVYGDPRTWETFRNSVVLSLSEHVIGLCVAVAFAWIVTRTNTPFRRFVTPIMVIAFAVPNLFIAISYGLMAGSPKGLLNQFALLLIGGEQRAVFDVYSWGGLIFVGVLKVVPIMYLLLLGPFSALNRSLEEAAIMAGGNRASTFFRIQLPLLAPALTGLAILGLVTGLGSLETALVLGVPAGIYVFPSRIYQYLAGGAAPEYAEANALSILLVAIVFILIAIRHAVLGKRDFVTLTGKSYSNDPWNIGRWKWVCFAAIVLYAMFGLVLPVGQLVIGSLQPIFGVSKVLNFSNYAELLDNSVAVSAITNSLLVGVVGGFLAACLAVLISYTAHRSVSRLRRIPEFMVWIVVAFPGIVLGLGMLWAYLSVPFLRPLYGSIAIVMIALVVYISPTAVRSIDGAMAQIDRQLEESARMSGASAIRTVAGIVAPLISRSFLATWFVAAVAIAGNLDVPILLSGPGNQTVPVLTYNFYTQNGQVELAAAMQCLLLGIAGVVFLVLRLLQWVFATWLSSRSRSRSERSRKVQGESIDVNGVVR